MLEVTLITELSLTNDTFPFDRVPEGTFQAYSVTELTPDDLPGFTTLMRRVAFETADFLDDNAKAEALAIKNTGLL